MLVFVAQEGAEPDVARLMRSEMHRFAAAITVGLREHQPASDQSCHCGRAGCDHLFQVHRALLIPQDQVPQATLA